MGISTVGGPEGFEEPNRTFFFCDALACDAATDGELLRMCWVIGLGGRPLKRFEKAGGCCIRVVGKLNG